MHETDQSAITIKLTAVHSEGAENDFVSSVHALSLFILIGGFIVGFLLGIFLESLIAWVCCWAACIIGGIVLYAVSETVRLLDSIADKEFNMTIDKSLLSKFLLSEEIQQNSEPQRASAFLKSVYIRKSTAFWYIPKGRAFLF